MTDNLDSHPSFHYDHEYEQLVAAMVAFTGRKIQAACAEYGLTWLGAAGPVYDVWDGNLARAVYRDQAGHDYVDAELFKETLGGDIRKWSWITDALCGTVPFVEHTLVTPSRGTSIAECVPVDELSALFHTEPTRLPATLWARTWWSNPAITDAAEHGLIAAAEDPRVGGISRLVSRIPAELA